MELHETDLAALQKKVLNIFLKTIQFLDAHNLSWYAAYGTAIGATRHKDIIPWDDDVDIYMPYDDYIALSSFRKELEPLGLSFDEALSHTNCCLWAKISDTNSTIWQFQCLDEISGVWIDIFPLYSTNLQEKEFAYCHKKYISLYNKYQRSHMIFNSSEIWSLIKHGHLLTLKQRALGLLYYRFFKKTIRNECISFLESLHDSKGKFVMAPDSFADLFPQEWFSSYYEEHFNNFKVRLPIGVDMILSKIYGDYMTPPPIAKRGTSHSFYFYDLYKRYTKKEILSIIESKPKKR